MSYTVLARKYRSQTFDDLVGQEAIATTLKNAVTSKRIHHGYLFTGTRGVGKTSTARVLAKALNCSSFDNPTATPCGTCETCRMIAEGVDIDVIEIDAASNTGVENIRDLRDNTAYRPARSRYKVYIIDEVHMLSTGAFNALLKTLEEPPEHVKFILATTEIHKVPATIISRCQRFDFRSISIDAISGHLRNVLEKEKVTADDTVLRRIARLAQGSMRDAMSLLDQILSFGGGSLNAKVLDDILPGGRNEDICELVGCIADQDASSALRCVENILASGQTTERFCEMLIDHLRMLMILKVCGADTDVLDLSTPDRDQLAEQAQRFDASTYVYMISLAEEARRSVKSSNSSRALLDAAVVRLSLSGNFTDIGDILRQLQEAPERSSRPSAMAPTETARPSPSATSSATSPKSSNMTARRTTPSPPNMGSSPAISPSPATVVPPSEIPQYKPVSSNEESRVRQNQTVRQTMELFDATLMNVQRRVGNSVVSNGPHDENEATTDERDNSFDEGKV